MWVRAVRISRPSFAVWLSSHSGRAESPGLRGTTGWELGDAEGKKKEGAVGLRMGLPGGVHGVSERNPPERCRCLGRLLLPSPTPGAALARWNLPVPADPAGTCCPTGLTQRPGHVISQTLTLPLSRWPGLTRRGHLPGAHKHVFLSTASSVPHTRPGLGRLGPDGLRAALSTWPRGLLAVQLPRRRVSNRRPVLLSPTVSKTHS